MKIIDGNFSNGPKPATGVMAHIEREVGANPLIRSRLQNGFGQVLLRAIVRGLLLALGGSDRGDGYIELDIDVNLPSKPEKCGTPSQVEGWVRKPGGDDPINEAFDGLAEAISALSDQLDALPTSKDVANIKRQLGQVRAQVSRARTGKGGEPEDDGETAEE